MKSRLKFGLVRFYSTNSGFTLRLDQLNKFHDVLSTFVEQKYVSASAAQIDLLRKGFEQSHEQHKLAGNQELCALYQDFSESCQKLSSLHSKESFIADLCMTGSMLIGVYLAMGISYSVLAAAIEAEQPMIGLQLIVLAPTAVLLSRKGNDHLDNLKKITHEIYQPLKNTKEKLEEHIKANDSKVSLKI